MAVPQNLEHLARAIHTCQHCPLNRLRIAAVPGEGPARAEILFIGEAPGANEDRQGRPFVGRSGALLEKLLASIQLRREDVFITNIIKCRPPANRDPMPAEIAACTPWLEQQLALLNPLLIVTLGRFSMAHFFGPHARITKIHGQAQMQELRAIMPMFHPAAALRNPAWKREMEADFAKIPSLLADVRAQRAQTDAHPAQLDLF
jgi:DNA polymerase